MRRLLHRGVEGSIPMVILVAIVLGGLIIALYATVRSGSESARRDRDFQQAIHAADAGLQESFVILREVGPGETPPCDTNGDGICSGALSDGSTYVWEYNRLGDRRWEVRSSGTYRDQTRIVEANVGETPLYDAAMIGKQFFTYNGGGTGTDPFAAGTFHDATLNGNPAIDSIGQILLYGDGPHHVNIPPETVAQEKKEAPFMGNLAEAAFEPGGACDGEPYYEVYPEDVDDRDPNRHGNVYCVGKVDFGNGDHQLKGSQGDGPVVIFVDQHGSTAFRTTGNARVNFFGDSRTAADLQVYVAAGDVTIGGTSKVRAAIWAPASACTSNGGTDFHGAMVCNTITLNGNFEFDPNVEMLTDDEFSISGWREEHAGTTSF